VNLSPVGATQPSTVVALDDADCDCSMFTGKTVWPDR
jgi:hypothetical protein